ncbi:MAG: polysaccharide pyruvyl transferase family protein [Phycisphaerae bacterium]
MGSAGRFGDGTELMGVLRNFASVAGKLKSDPAMLFRYSPARLARLGLFYLFGRSPLEPRSLLPEPGPPKGTLAHVALFTDTNAGDTLLPLCVRDLIAATAGPVQWRTIHAHVSVSNRRVRAINASAGLIIGGGGMFLKDTNPNSASGWQWDCSLEALRNIEVPLAVFAVGYNRFRGQADFDDVFRQHLELLAEKAVFIGLRNHGSMERVQEYRPSALRDRVIYQPCPTTLLRRLYPNLFEAPRPGQPCLALNCAFDREDLRFGRRKVEILRSIALAMKQLSARLPIRYYAHARTDEAMLPVLDDARVPYELVRLYEVPPRAIIEAYRDCAIAVGMRGHAQMIPFGCGVPALSLISHDKLRWFLEDIREPSWGVDVSQDRLAERLVERAGHMLDCRRDVQEAIDQKQRHLWNVSIRNVETLGENFGL